MKSPDDDPSFDFPRALRTWVLGPCLTPEDIQLIAHLRQIAVELARNHLASKPIVTPPGYLDAEDLAGEFLDSLRKKGNWMIRTRGGLSVEYRRWVTRFTSPAHHEIWEIVSTALHELARAGVAWRLDASPEEENRNDAIWTGLPGDAGRKSCNLVEFETAARGVPNYPPPAARRWHDEGAAMPKVIAPKDARDLTRALLQAARGSLRLADLIEEFKRHVFVLIVGPLENTSESVGQAIHPAALIRLFDLAQDRAELIWTETAEGGFTDLLCKYFIANHLQGRHVALEEFGDPRRVHERLQRVVTILRRHLALDVGEALDLESADLDTSFHSRFVIEAMHGILEKCGCLSGKPANPVLPIEVKKKP